MKVYQTTFSWFMTYTFSLFLRAKYYYHTRGLILSDINLFKGIHPLSNAFFLATNKLFYKIYQNVIKVFEKNSIESPASSTYKIKSIRITSLTCNTLAVRRGRASSWPHIRPLRWSHHSWPILWYIDVFMWQEYNFSDNLHSRINQREPWEYEGVNQECWGTEDRQRV